MKVSKGKSFGKVLVSMSNKQAIKRSHSAVPVVSMIKIICMSGLRWQLFLTLITASGLIAAYATKLIAVFLSC